MARKWANAATVCLGVLGALTTTRANALGFDEIDGVQINLDTTLSGGFDLRTSPIDYTFVGMNNRGKLGKSIQDDGTLNFRDGSIVSAPFRATEELQAKYGDYGVFVRATELYNPIYDGVSPDFQKFARATVRDLGADARLLDAFTFGDFDLGNRKITYRLGNQVINWGESIYIQGGINSFSIFDANALESPGAELREAVLPLPGIDLRTDIAENLSVEGFYEVYWNRTRFEPDGSFFSTTDTLSDGGYFSVTDQSFPDNAVTGYNKTNLFNNDVLGGVVLRSRDKHPKNGGEFALAMRYTAPFLDDAEFGLYYENYHSRIPFLAYRTGAASSVRTTIPVLFGFPGRTYLTTASFLDDYPADIRLIGASFSTTIAGGFGLQGEWSHKFDQPLLLSTADTGLLLEGPGLCGLAKALPVSLLQAACFAASTDPVTVAAGGLPGFSQYTRAWKRYPVDQFQASITKVFDPIPEVGVSSWTFVTEAGLDYIPNFPRKAGIFDTGVPNATNTYSAFTPLVARPDGRLQTKGLATQAAGGYVSTVTFDMPEVLPYAIDMQPSIAWQHSVAGRDAQGAGFFQEGNAAISLGVTFTYLQRIKFAVQYTNHVAIGPASFYQLSDRDFVSGAFSYTF